MNFGSELPAKGRAVLATRFPFTAGTIPKAKLSIYRSSLPVQAD